MPMQSHAIAPAAATLPLSEQDEFGAFVSYIEGLQERILREAEEIDGSGAKFVVDRWQRDPTDPHAGKQAFEGRDSCPGVHFLKWQK
jgi:hypothetical protein